MLQDSSNLGLIRYALAKTQEERQDRVNARGTKELKHIFLIVHMKYNLNDQTTDIENHYVSLLEGWDIYVLEQLRNNNLSEMNQIIAEDSAMKVIKNFAESSFADILRVSLQDCYFKLNIQIDNETSEGFKINQHILKLSLFLFDPRLSSYIVPELKKKTMEIFELSMKNPIIARKMKAAQKKDWKVDLLSRSEYTGETVVGLHDKLVRFVSNALKDAIFQLIYELESASALECTYSFPPELTEYLICLLYTSPSPRDS
eukprot:TRINITY_DN25262_c0_g1_i1.p1 TRINITY_DN25262_c0_g1~~TRINITY_DN25262_c0_g1_i1.p1  ORF type:complete len:259 (-),score=98.80 TRINITY_DN25262_c0_g1_i1:37-813(-)